MKKILESCLRGCREFFCAPVCVAICFFIIFMAGLFMAVHHEEQKWAEEGPQVLRAEIQSLSAGHVGCVPSEMEIGDAVCHDRSCRLGPASWTLKCRGRFWACCRERQHSSYAGGGSYKTTCSRLEGGGG